MVRTRKAIYVGNQEVQRRYIGNKLIFEKSGDMEDKDKVSGTEIFTDKADNSVVHVEVDGVIGGLNNFDVVSSVGGRNYLLNSDFSHSTNSNGWSDTYGKHEITDEGSLKTYPASSSAMRIEKEFYLDEIGTFTFSMYAKTSEDILWQAHVGIESVNKLETAISDEFKIYHFSFENKVAGDKKIRGYQRSAPVGTQILIRREKLERGSAVTPWVLAPEDITENDNHPLIDKINISLSEPLRSVGDVKDRLFRDNDGLWKVEWNVHTSGVEILSQEMQDKLNNLRSFQGSNYVYTISDTDISPTLHATFKSKS